MGIVYMFFVYDILTFVKGEIKSVLKLIYLFKRFFDVLGLYVNVMKFNIYFVGVITEVQKEINEVVGFVTGFILLLD